VIRISATRSLESLALCCDLHGPHRHGDNQFVAYALEPGAAWITASKWIVLATSFALIAALILLARVGFHIGKWVTNTGGFFTLLVLGALVLMPLFHSLSVTPAGYHPLRAVLPPPTFFTLSVFSKMALGALCGFEYLAIFSGECRNPKRNLAHSILLTAPVIALLYISEPAPSWPSFPPTRLTSQQPSRKP